MKTAIYIEDGVVQLVLTPDNEFEHDAISSFKDGPITAQIFNGTFYDCRGGWTRQTDVAYDGRPHNTSDNSLIIRSDIRNDAKVKE